MSSNARQFIVEALAPLNLAAYAAWAVVSWETEARLVGAEPAWVWLTRAALLSFLLGFISVTSAEQRLSFGRYAWIAAAMAVCSLAASAYRPTGTGPILMVLVAAMFALRLELRWLIVSLATLNAAYLALLYLRTGANLSQLAITSLAYISFQAFAALVMRNTRRAETMSEELRAANAELLTSRTLLAESTRDQERLALSRELHDVAGHTLTALKLNLSALMRDSRQPDPARVKLCAELADELLQTLRSVVQQTRARNDLDLGQAIARLGVSFTRPSMHLEMPGDLRLGSQPVFEAVLRAVQEALTNAARHGLSRHLWVRLKTDENGLQLDIEDDGRVSWPLTPGGGLSGMRERFEQIGGELRWSISQRGGLHLQARCPLRQGRPPSAGLARVSGEASKEPAA
ncbi:sensor histidine kinase [Pseudomarimonas arenosa]|uniref:Signal transduction histidine kinase n=1 Tax=Pseudomarimonas arenosa TaxID=2774145 RepID=A0AAW3ZVN0_9GAMM|nr:histidine kinase [Pseudomarimonas arenosa]MBD8528111.1 hypothetical protein [Pseudomarimonas arenosa]